MAAQAKVLQRLRKYSLQLLDVLPVSTTLQRLRYQKGRTYFSVSSQPKCRYVHEILWQKKMLLTSSINFIKQQVFCTPVSRAISQQHSSALPPKKRSQRKRSISATKDDTVKDEWTVVANATAEEYDLESLIVELKRQGLYHMTPMPEDLHDALHVCAKYQTDAEPREIYFFREGSVVFWNVPEIERYEVMKFLRNHETNSYEESLVLEEGEVMSYIYADKAKLLGERILLSTGDSGLEKYAFSNGMALSVKLALWEATLDQFVDSIEWITENMKSGKKINITKDQVFRKTGELYALRHHINLSSDLLDTPDFYWDRQNLESLYQKTCNHLNISKRTKVMNEKLNHCCELMQLLNHHLSDNHHVRLELMIIALILVEVVFEFLHWQEKIVSMIVGLLHSDTAPADR